jgi:hypothetical protein
MLFSKAHLYLSGSICMQLVGEQSSYLIDGNDGTNIRSQSRISRDARLPHVLAWLCHLAAGNIRVESFRGLMIDNIDDASQSVRIASSSSGLPVNGRPGEKAAASERPDQRVSEATGDKRCLVGNCVLMTRLKRYYSEAASSWWRPSTYPLPCLWIAVAQATLFLRQRVARFTKGQDGTTAFLQDKVGFSRRVRATSCRLRSRKLRTTICPLDDLVTGMRSPCSRVPPKITTPSTKSKTPTVVSSHLPIARLSAG